MLSFSKISTAELARIAEIRGQSSQKMRLDESSAGGGNEFSFPHETYTLGLDALNESKVTAMPSAIRVIETGLEHFEVIYDVYKGNGPQMFHDKRFVSDYEKVFERIAPLATDSANYEVRTIRVPALYIEAIWLHEASNPSNDRFIFVRNRRDLPDVIVGQEAFLSRLRGLAQGIDKDDELLGS